MNFIVSDTMPQMPGGHLFNDPDFHALKKGKIVCYRWDDNDRVVARLSFYLIDQEAISGYQAPFGSIDFIQEAERENIHLFIEAFVDDLKRMGLEQVQIRMPPGYCHFMRPIERELLAFGFKEKIIELNQHLAVDHIPFIKKITQKERNKLNRARNEGYRMVQLGRDHIAAAFALILDTHGRKNYPVSFKEQEFEQANDQMPGRYMLFGLFDKTELIAVVASVLVTEAVLYNFYHADHADYRSRSPLVMLIGEIYGYCQEKDIKILDLGISSVGGRLNDGLFRFKKNLGCLTSDKKILALNLST